MGAGFSESGAADDADTGEEGVASGGEVFAVAGFWVGCGDATGLGSVEMGDGGVVVAEERGEKCAEVGLGGEEESWCAVAETFGENGGTAGYRRLGRRGRLAEGDGDCMVESVEDVRAAKGKIVSMNVTW